MMSMVMFRSEAGYLQSHLVSRIIIMGQAVTSKLLNKFAIFSLSNTGRKVLLEQSLLVILHFYRYTAVIPLDFQDLVIFSLQI